MRPLVTGLVAVGSCQFPAYDLQDPVVATAGSPDQTPSGGSAGAGQSSGGSSHAGTGASGGLAGTAGQSVEPAAGAAGEGGAGSVDNLLFSDDFEDGMDAWTPTTPPDWSLVDDGSNTVFFQGTISDDTRLAFGGDPTWTDVAVEARVRIVEFGGTDTADLVALYVRCQDLDNYYYVALRSDGRLAIKGRIDGGDSTLGASANPMLTAGVWYTVKLEAIGNVINAHLDGVFWSTVVVQPVDAIAAGSVGVGTGNASAEFDDVRVTSIP